MREETHDADGGEPSARTTGPGGRLSRRSYLAGAAAVGLGGIAATGAALGERGHDRTGFTVRIENVSDGSTLETSAAGEASEQPVPLSPGVFAVHTRDRPLFAAGEPERDNGLEEVAEDGMPGRLAASAAARDSVATSGTFTTPVGADGPGPLAPGEAYEFSFAVGPGGPSRYLSFVTMFVPSNDLFYAIGGDDGTRLFDGNEPLRGDVTDRVGLWDAGTEVNEEPGVGANQVQRQRAAGVGLVERGTVAPIGAVNGYEYPDPGDVLRVRVTPEGSEGGNGT